VPWNHTLSSISHYTMMYLSTTRLCKAFGKHQILSDIDLDVAAGEITVVTGANGSGKTTLLQCLSGLIKPTSGAIQVLGFDANEQEKEVKRLLAYVPDVPKFYAELTAWEHLMLIGRAHGVQQNLEGFIQELMVEFGLWQARDLFPHHYSRGMSLKLGLCLAFIRPYKVLALDEPTASLDLESSLVLGEYLKKSRSKGNAVLMITHDKAIIEKLADRILRLQDGKLSATSNTDQA